MLAGFDVRKADYQALAEILKQAIIENRPVEWVAQQCAARLSVDGVRFLYFCGVNECTELKVLATRPISVNRPLTRVMSY